MDKYLKILLLTHYSFISMGIVHRVNYALCSGHRVSNNITILLEPNQKNKKTSPCYGKSIEVISYSGCTNIKCQSGSVLPPVGTGFYIKPLATCYNYLIFSPRLLKISKKISS
jgi:hypothetical protein